MTLGDAFDYGLERIHRAIRNCESARLDPPAEVELIDCTFCNGNGHYEPQPHCGGANCNHEKFCCCDCAQCAYVECDLCHGEGVIPKED